MIAIVFHKGYGTYVKGDTAGFDEATAHKIVGFGVATFLNSTDADRVAPTGGVIPNLPDQIKIAHLCAICGMEFKDDSKLKKHKATKHGL